MELKGLLTADQIIYSLKGKRKNDIVNELLQILNKSGKLKDKHMALQSILSREDQLSTGMEHGLALPHAKTDAVDELVIAFGLHRKGVDFETIDGQPAHFIFLVLSPYDTSGPHIQALAQIARIMKPAETRKKLLNSKSAEDIESILTHSE